VNHSGGGGRGLVTVLVPIRYRDPSVLDIRHVQISRC
jgi:hypothetical protein